MSESSTAFVPSSNFRGDKSVTRKIRSSENRIPFRVLARLAYGKSAELALAKTPSSNPRRETQWASPKTNVRLLHKAKAVSVKLPMTSLYSFFAHRIPFKHDAYQPHHAGAGTKFGSLPIARIEPAASSLCPVAMYIDVPKCTLIGGAKNDVGDGAASCELKAPFATRSHLATLRKLTKPVGHPWSDPPRRIRVALNPNRSIPAFRSEVESARSARPRLTPNAGTLCPEPNVSTGGRHEAVAHVSNAATILWKNLDLSAQAEPSRGGCSPDQFRLGVVVDRGLQMRCASRHGGNAHKSEGVGPTASGAVWLGQNRPNGQLPSDLTRPSQFNEAFR